MKIKNIKPKNISDCNKKYFNKPIPKPNILFNDKHLIRNYNNYNIEIVTNAKITNNQIQELFNLEYWYNYFTHYPNYYIYKENRIFFIPYSFSGLSKNLIKKIILNYFSCDYNLYKSGYLNYSYSNIHNNEILVNKEKFFINDIKSEIVKNIKSNIIDNSDSGSSYDQNKEVVDNNYKIVTLNFKNIPFDPINKIYLKTLPNPDIPYENDLKN